MAPVLGYWKIRGLGEPIRYMLHYLNVEFEDKRYEFGPEPNYKDSEWTRNDKKELGLELPNLPYYIDGNVKISQSLAIMRHLARKHNLYYPTSDPDMVRFETMEGHARDLTTNFAMMVYNPAFQKFKDIFAPRIKAQIKAAADFLGNKEWVFGNQISHVDFILFESLDKLKMYSTDFCDDHENIVNFMKRFTSLPGVAKYMETSPRWPLFMPYAFWGGKGDAPS